MSEIQFIFPERSEDEISESLRELTAALEARGGDSGYGIGGEHGYGCNYESDLFLMHRYCWCEREECPWCGGCQAGYPEPTHGPACYQTRLEELRRTYGTEEAWGWDVRHEKRYEAAKRRLCSELDLDYHFGNEVHCTCGATEGYMALVSACVCDSCAATGAWGRHGAVRGRRAPNFWHKPSGLRVWWYKWIGRSMEVVKAEGVDTLAAVRECIASLPPQEGAP